MNIYPKISQFKWIWILIFPIRVELNIRKISKNAIQVESIRINSNRFESNAIRVGSLVHVESSQTPSSGNKSQARAKASPYVVFVPSKFFKKITSNEKSTVYKCLLGCPSTRTTTVFHSSLMNARRHITVSVHSQHYYFTKETS